MPHPEFQFFLGKTDGHFSVTGARSGDGSSVIWLVVAKAAGSKSSRVELRSKGARPEELDEVWQVFEACEDQ